MNAPKTRWGVQDTVHLVELFVKLIQLRGLCHDILVHHERGLYLFVSSLAQKVEPVRDERLIEVDAIVREEVATVTGDLGSCKGCEEGREEMRGRSAPRSRSIASNLSSTSWCAKISVFLSTWPLGPSGCHVFSVALSSWIEMLPSCERCAGNGE